MSLVPRVLSAHHGKKKSSWRKPVMIFVVLLALVLLGTVIVLSSVKSYFGVPASAFITEHEVPWKNGLDVIKLLTPEPVSNDTSAVSSGEAVTADLSSSAEAVPISKRARAKTLKALRALDADAPLPDTVADVDAETTGEASALLDDELDLSLGVLDLPAAAANDDDDFTLSAEEEEEDEDVWGVDGKGTGGYWMRNGWDGRVEGTNSWDHLYNVTLKEGENIPRIIHQTWKTDTLPAKWRTAWKECREGMDDYAYMLWTDATAREFVEKHYPAHLPMYDGYRYPIQRADSIRYMILHHFGGVYMDLDIGCRRRMDLLLEGDWEVLLPITKPVGISNDLIFSSKHSAFMEQTVNGLAAFNHQFVTNYPTVMFSTGPMFLSAQFSIWRSTHAQHLVRVIPKALYGKNAPQSAVPHSFFSHFYGSSWHADDAGFITWLGTWGKGLMAVGCLVLVIGAVRLVYSKKQNGSLRNVLPFGKRSEYHLLPVGVPYDPSGRMSPSSSLGSGPISPSTETPPDFSSALRRAGNMILAAPAALVASSTNDGRGQRHKGWLYFVPAKFQQQQQAGGRRRTASEASRMPLRKSSRHPAPPPYEPAHGVGAASSDPTMQDVDAFLKHDGAAADFELDEFTDEGSVASASGTAGGGSAEERAGWTAEEGEGEGRWQDWGGDGSWQGRSK